MKALVTGATGFVGSELLNRLEEAVVLSRNADRTRSVLGVQAFDWVPVQGLPPQAAFDGVDTVFHLAGDPVAQGRWTSAKKARIRTSRVLGTRNLVDRLATLERRPKSLISASAVGFYGFRGDTLLDEDASPANSFLSDVCREWEQEAQRAEDLGIRVVSVRIGIVLGHGGALASMLPIFRLGVGGRLGNGRQWMPWIHVDDLIGLMLLAATDSRIQGAINGVAPNPVTNREFTRQLARSLHRPALFPAPALALRLALGEFASVLLSSQRVVPGVAASAGYTYKYPELDMALEAILNQRELEPDKQDVRVA